MKLTLRMMASQRYDVVSTYLQFKRQDRTKDLMDMIVEPLLITDHDRNFVLPTRNDAWEYFEREADLENKLNVTAETVNAWWSQLGKFFGHYNATVKIMRGEQYYDKICYCFFFIFNGEDWRIAHVLKYSPVKKLEDIIS